MTDSGRRTSLRDLPHILSAVLATAIVCGCAAAPETIPEKPVDKARYEDWSCRELDEEGADIKDLLSSGYVAQERVRRDNEIALVVLGVPLSSLEGNDRATEISLLKGMMRALQEQRAAKNCPASASNEDLPKSP